MEEEREGERKRKMDKRERDEKYPHSKEPFPPEISVFTSLALGGNF